MWRDIMQYIGSLCIQAIRWHDDPRHASIVNKKASYIVNVCVSHHEHENYDMKAYKL